MVQGLLGNSSYSKSRSPITPSIISHKMHKTKVFERPANSDKMTSGYNSDMSEIIPVGDLWFPPANILYHGHWKLKGKTTSDERKQIKEAMSGAVMLVGINKATKENFRLQLVDPRKEQTPDIRTMRLIETNGEPNQMEVQEVEIVTLEENSSDDVDDFLKRTKLSSMKAYPQKMIILCHINKKMKKNKSWRQVYESLNDNPIPNDVYVLARVDTEKQKYQLAKIHPTLEIVEFDVMDELFSRPKQKVLKLRRGTAPVMEELDEINFPFSAL
jgi:hypothetical protein